MAGIAESDAFSVSRRIVDNFKIGETYSVSEVEEILGYKPGGADRKGVLGGKKTDFLCLKVTLEKNYLNSNYNDHLEGTTFFWSGQNNRRFAEDCIVDGRHDVFIFIRPFFSNSFLYYGRGVPLRMSLSQTKGTPSHVVFDLYEYARSEYGLSVNDYFRSYDREKYRRESLQVWNYRCAANGVNDESLLVTRHIKPIHESRRSEVPDEYNSIVLTPELDNLFSRGIISFDRSGRIWLPPSVSLRENLRRMHVDTDVRLSQVPDATRDYLDYHNNYVFGFSNYVTDWKYR